ncbi:tetratricopeptide repeat protein [Sphaerotilus mobilis]|uniref:Sel1 repeat-containing protein n=1 Tax=Sphaerotilus mobilis TaxID=47994 RepID=A0A4Q7LKH6_9BURK|nr:tetratricopeptide repeat protein [Sphaerotilus mobilis]RZS54944.1 Sel1 repeat-containing protein [Sphaerotilus mobilis]
MRPWIALALSTLINLCCWPAAHAAEPVPAGESVAVLQGQADQGDRSARTRLARRYETGEGVPQDVGKAAQLYEQAAHLGDPDAQFALAAMFREGRGVEQDRLFSLVWLRKAATNGHPQARAMVGLPPLVPPPVPPAPAAAASR